MSGSAETLDPIESRVRSILRILICGKDGRTDALAEACQRSSYPVKLYAYSEFRIPGLLEKCVDLKEGSLTEVKAIAQYADEIKPHLAVIGPEEPLQAGLVDALEAANIPCFGPTKALARIETSKTWARELLTKYGIQGNPRYRAFRQLDGLREFLTELEEFVIKPDGLTGGKGVKVFGEHLDGINDALDYAEEVLPTHKAVIVEERLEGEEFSLQTITDGKTAIHCPLVQDHKRAYDEDLAPNTGGMGSYSFADHSLPFLTEEDLRIAQAINESVIEALFADTGQRYKGVLYGGFMATAKGIRLIEYNARFGDPEAMNVLPILQGDFVEMCLAIAKGNLTKQFTFDHKATVCKYVVPEHYPESKGGGDVIQMDQTLLPTPDRHIYWAAVNQRESGVSLTGSRALAFVGVGATPAEAERLAEEGAASVKGPIRHRKDIGTDTAIQGRIEHMRRVRVSG